MTLLTQIQQDIKAAMREQDRKKVSALRLITAAVKQIEVDERIEVSDERLLVILDKLLKQRKESITQFKSAGRDDLVEIELYELDLIQSYLPPQLTEAELLALIEESLEKTGASQISDMGRVMADLKPKVQGRCDMAQVSAQIKSRLQAP